VILGTFGSFLASLTLDQWVKLAPAAVEFVTAAVKLGEQVEPIISKKSAEIAAQAKSSGHMPHGVLAAHADWVDAWTLVDQRIYDQQNASRG
jgi:hypothetical protein